MDDATEQANELTVIDSIYSSCFVKDELSQGGKIEIPVALDKKLTLRYSSERVLDIASQVQQTTGDKDASTKTITLSYLPPIVLHFSYPNDYPSVHSPGYTLTCRWLTVRQLELLCQRLDQLWLDQGAGSVIVFQWIQYLFDDALNILDVKSPFTLQVDHCASVLSGRRSFQEVSSIEALASTLIIYNQQQEEAAFNCATFSCAVCFSDVRGADCVAFQPCGHIYCKMCMAEYFKVQITDGAVTRLTCPYDGCMTQANPKQVQRLVDPELYSRYEKFLLQSGLDSMADVVYCPRRDCQKPVVIEDVNAPCVCSTCFYAFCLSCKRSYHGISPCPVSAKEFEKIRKQYEEGSNDDRERLENRYGRKRLKHLLEDSISEEWLEQNAKKCPVCKASIEKTQGCNKMTCLQCSRSFCWICLSILPNTNPYHHFNSMYSNCFNKLFEGMVVDDEEEFALE